MRILWIPHYPWRNPQRAKLFCEKLSERHEVHVTDVYTDFKSLKEYASRRYLEGYFYGERRDGNVMVHRIPRISPALPLRILRSINSKIFSKYVSNIIKKDGIEAVVGTFVCRPPKAECLVFDLFDDNPAYWREYGRIKSYADEIEAVEREYVEKADKIVAASSVLAEKVKEKEVHLIPNGVDLVRFRRANGSKVRKKLGLEGTVVGFIGNQDKYKELYKVAKASEHLYDEDLTFLIVGKGSAISPIKKYLDRKKISNFRFTGFVNPSEIPEYCKAIDIGLCPYMKTKSDDARSPMKLLDYTAAGKPVVATELEEIRRMNFSNVILVKDDPASLAEGIRKAIGSDVRIPAEIEKYDIDKLAKKYERVIAG
jgi:glycosyltransferase involved in cell wall biosynthesis